MSHTFPRRLVHVITSFYPETHLIREEAETQRGKVSGPRGPNWDVREQVLLYSKTLIILVNPWGDIKDEKTVERAPGKGGGGGDAGGGGGGGVNHQWNVMNYSL